MTTKNEVLRCLVVQQKDPTRYKAIIERMRLDGHNWDWQGTLQGVDGTGVTYNEAVEYGRQYANGNVVLA